MREDFDKPLSFLTGKDPGDEQPLDLFSDDEITEILNSIDREREPKTPYPWLDFKGWKPKEYRCTCGAEKTYGKDTSHSTWCDVK